MPSPALHTGRQPRAQRAWLLLPVLLLGWLAAMPVYAQQDVAVDVASFQGPGAEDGRLHIYTTVPHPLLTFYDVGETFEARYQVWVDAFAVDERGRRQELVRQETWTYGVAVPSFDLTQQPAVHHYAYAVLPLRGGSYSLTVRVEDSASGRQWTEEVDVSVRTQEGPGLSDLVVMDGYLEADQPMRALVPAQVPLDQLRLRLGYEVYGQREQTARAVVELLGPRTEEGRIPLVGSLLGLRREDLGAVQYTGTQVVRLEAEPVRQVVTVPTADLEPGHYLVRLRLQDEQGEVLDLVEKSVVLIPSADPAELDLDRAIAQLRYIAKAREVEHILEGRTPAERQARFAAFWERRDPTPRTARNERMMEYYHRLHTANRWWQGRAPGWQTDRGHVFVLFGEPDYVDRTTEGGTPTEVWHYERIGRRFIFVGQGDGQLRLRIPIWDERTRIR